MPIHHDVRLHQPGAEYLAALKQVVEQVAGLAPQVLKDLSYFFDPAEILRPCFYHVYRVEESWYLYLLRIDLMMRAAESAIIERGTNDTTAVLQVAQALPGDDGPSPDGSGESKTAPRRPSTSGRRFHRHGSGNRGAGISSRASGWTRT